MHPALIATCSFSILLDWMMLTAGSVSDTNVQLQFVSDIHDYAAVNRNNTPLALSYDTSNGAIHDQANIAR